ncbi:sarcosine oxidase subunit gamma [Beijerinckia sp. L45]|uniref:sarcosine oxidase subunit gamma n=1 Tax=Beijerinckia sp. L45 TaxID=1641855 RepID=UPI00131AB466|nr:sarcosine oxidase subunit gamma family protein [Beijerinckia sp. L45]
MSDSAPTTWQQRSGWAGVTQTGRFGRAGGDPGVRLDLLGRQALATIIVRPGEEAALDRLMQERLGVALPATGRAAFASAGSLVWSAPGQWLVMGPAASALADLPQRLAGVAAVTDQSDGRALVRVGGADARALLAKGVSIDLHPSVFAAGATAVTSVAHINIQLWQVDDAPTYVLAVPRGFAGSFWSWLTAAAAEYGYDVQQVPA